MTYPNVLDEWQTLELLHQGYSIGRFGDGELNLCHGLPAKCQVPDELLANCLKAVLAFPKNKFLVGIPRIGKDALLPEKKRFFWKKYRDQKYTALYQQWQYASAFITRPDSIPAINIAAYWDRVFALWEGRDVLLVEGKNYYFDSQTSPAFNNARSVKHLEVHSVNAWAHHRKILDRILDIASPETLILLSVGPTATVLARILSANFQALDLGHLFFLHQKMFIDGLEH